MKRIAVGSKNPVKIKSAEIAFKNVWPDEDWEVFGVSVQSGVSDQPMSKEETVQGARNRASQALGEGVDFGVGIEGGLYEFDGDYYDATWVVVLDSNKNEGIGSTLSLKMPEPIMEQIHDGKELGDVIDEVFDGEDLAKKQGYFGLMTKNVVTRTDGYVHGVVSALARFVHEDLFN